MQIWLSQRITQGGNYLQTSSKHRPEENSREKLVAQLHLRPNNEDFKRPTVKGEGTLREVATEAAKGVNRGREESPRVAATAGLEKIFGWLARKRQISSRHGFYNFVQRKGRENYSHISWKAEEHHWQVTQRRLEEILAIVWQNIWNWHLPSRYGPQLNADLSYP